jgi:hypothetical protein
MGMGMWLLAGASACLLCTPGTYRASTGPLLRAFGSGVTELGNS